MTSAPFHVHRDVMRPERIDDNGHLNMGYYVVAFDREFTGIDQEGNR